VGAWVSAPTPKPPIPNPQSPIPNPLFLYYIQFLYKNIFKLIMNNQIIPNKNSKFYKINGFSLPLEIHQVFTWILSFYFF